MSAIPNPDEWREQFDRRMERLESALKAATDERPISERLDEYLRTGKASEGLQVELLQLQLKAARDRLACAHTWFRREHLAAETEADSLAAEDLSLMIDVLAGGDSEAVRHVRDQLRADPHYRASLNRISDWLADGAIGAILEQGK